MAETEAEDLAGPKWRASAWMLCVTCLAPRGCGVPAAPVLCPGRLGVRQAFLSLGPHLWPNSTGIANKRTHASLPAVTYLINTLAGRGQAR